MVKYCEPFQNARAAFESAGLHDIITALGICKLGRTEYGVWFVVWGF